MTRPMTARRRRAHAFARLCLATVAALAAGSGTCLAASPQGVVAPVVAGAPWGGMDEPAPVPYTPPQPRAMALSSEWIQIVLPEVPYQAPAVDDPANYRIRLPGGAEVAPAAVMRRHAPSELPYNTATHISVGTEAIARIRTTYRIFLRLPGASPLNEGDSYRVTVDPAVIGGGRQFDFTFDPAAPNEAIHTNQVGYLTVAPKSARVSFWLGQGSVDFDAYPDFHIVDTATGATVFSGALTLLRRAADEPFPFAKSDLYEADFSAFTQEGSYRLHVPGVGSSYPFRIARSIPYELAFTVLRGMLHQRDGDHGLDRRARTAWTRPAAHVDDGIDETAGVRVDLAGGHMDAGDRGKYPYNMGLVGAFLLSGARMYPDAVVSLGDDLALPESGNGVPDYLDELVWELDAMQKMAENTALGGAQGHFLRVAPPSDVYELNAPMEGEPSRVFQSQSPGRSRANTLLVAGALAMAYNTPLFRQHYPDRAVRYLQAARKLFATYEAHAADDVFFNAEHQTPTFHVYDVFGDGRVTWSDEALFAASNLLEATGDTHYLATVQLEMPPDVTKVMRYGFVPQGPWLPAFLSVMLNAHPSVDAALRAKARAGVLHFANVVLNTQKTDHGALIDGRKATVAGWHFTAELAAMPMAFGHHATGDETYRHWAHTSWDYVLGTNPTSHSFISGLGQPDRRPRWQVHNLSRLQYRRWATGQDRGWPEMIPGIPEADVQNGGYNWWMTDPWNDPRKDPATGYHPALTEMPAMYRTNDGWTTDNEFVIPTLASQLVSLLPLIEAARALP